MKELGIMIRKINKSGINKITNPNKEELIKQVKTLHRKLKKNDSIITYYVVESDTNKRGKYHIHLLIRYNDEKNLYEQLSRFIGGNLWEERISGLNTLKTCKGKYGEVDSHFIYNEVGFLNYMEKKSIMETPLT